MAEFGVVVSAVNIVAGGAGHAVAVHHTLHKVVALHLVRMGSPIRIVQELSSSKGSVFEFRVVSKTETNVVANRPVIGFAVDEARARR